MGAVPIHFAASALPLRPDLFYLLDYDIWTEIFQITDWEKNKNKNLLEPDLIVIYYIIGVCIDTKWLWIYLQ